MDFFEIIKIAFVNLISYKVRSFLTMLGIIIGISSVIAMSAIGTGVQEQMLGDLNKLGIGNFEVAIDTNEKPRSRDLLTDLDIARIKNNPLVEGVVPSADLNGRINEKEYKNYTVIMGYNEETFDIQSTELLEGRTFFKNEYGKNSNLIIIDHITAGILYPGESAVSKTVTIDIRNKGRAQKKTFKIIGVFKNPIASLSSVFGGGPSFAIISLKHALFLSGGEQTRYSGLTVKVKDPGTLDAAMDWVEKDLTRNASKDKLYKVQNSGSGVDQFNNILSLLSLFISFVASISLFVGGIGVMNIMLVSVTERIKEIGLRKAIGAKTKDILLQFLIEAVMLTVIGGIIGIILGFGLAFLLGSLIGIPPGIRLNIVVISVLVSLTIGVVFGVYPAKKAAKLDPIEALRAE